MYVYFLLNKHALHSQFSIYQFIFLSISITFVFNYFLYILRSGSYFIAYFSTRVNLLE